MKTDKIAWSQDAEVELLRAYDGNADFLRPVELLVRAGLAALYQVETEEGRIGFFVLREDSPEVEVIAAAGDCGGNFIAEILPEIEQAARNAGAVGMKISTFRPGLMRWLERAGYTGLHITFWKRVANGV